MVVRVAATIDRQTFRCALRNSRVGINSLSGKPVNIFEHYHTIVQQHPHGERHAHQCQAVKGDAVGVEKVESGVNGNRDGQRDERDNPGHFSGTSTAQTRP